MNTVMEIYQVIIYIVAPIILIFLTTMINIFFSKMKKVSDIETKLNNLILNLQILITKFDNHLENHMSTSNTYTQQVETCKERFERLEDQIKNI